jgi:hypothetical protein
MPKTGQSLTDRSIAEHSITDRSITDQFWQYAKEAILLAAAAKTDDDRQGLFELSQTWTQAALEERSSTADPDSRLRPLPRHIIHSIERYRKVPRTSQSYRDPLERPHFVARERSHHVD